MPDCATVPKDLAAFIRSPRFPCVGAKASLAHNCLHAFEAGDIRAPTHDEELRRALISFAAVAEDDELSTFACVFRTVTPQLNEAAFEQALWTRLQALHDLDIADDVAWAGGVSNDPASPHFSMSVGGTAFFVVGLHPRASRLARRFARPAMIFNTHAQFQRLRADGRYASMQCANRQRDIALQGDINPMLANFGEGREAPQYSGRRVGEDWRCPFKAKT